MQLQVTTRVKLLDGSSDHFWTFRYTEYKFNLGEEAIMMVRTERCEILPSTKEVRLYLSDKITWETKAIVC